MTFIYRCNDENHTSGAIVRVRDASAWRSVKPGRLTRKPLFTAAVAMWLLLSQSVGVFVVTRTVSSVTLSALAITLSVLWFRRSMRDHVAFAPRRVAA